MHSYTAAVTRPAAIVVSDAHLGQAPPVVTEAFHAFLRSLPNRAFHLVINGDLFDFWFEYRTVIPRSAFRTLAALAAVRDAGTRVTVIGGNHDRWGGSFWERELGASFHRHGVELSLAGWRALVAHGDGMERNLSSRVLQALTRFPLTPRVFRWIHPDLGLRMVKRFSGQVAGDTRRAHVLASSAAQQSAYATNLLATRPELDLVVFGHTHRPVLESMGERRWYANPGAWMEGFRYLEITEAGPVLQQFNPNIL